MALTTPALLQGIDLRYETENRLVWNEREHRNEERELVYEISWIPELRRASLFAGTEEQIFFRITSECREFLLEQGTDQRYGACHLKRAIERYVVYPIARLLGTAQVDQGDDWSSIAIVAKKGLFS